MYEEEKHERDARKRSRENGCYRKFYVMVTSVPFNFFIFLLILGNTVTLSWYTYDQSPAEDEVISVFNEFFTWIFFLEMLCKIIGLGFKNYR